MSHSVGLPHYTFGIPVTNSAKGIARTLNNVLMGRHQLCILRRVRSFHVKTPQVLLLSNFGLSGVFAYVRPALL